ncbi:hypothetical protein MXB_3681 [Myxobolus squamalis]|nr:hypothetical protein MXB_3681 [Myxobolus squamalis]
MGSENPYQPLSRELSNLLIYLYFSACSCRYPDFSHPG